MPPLALASLFQDIVPWVSPQGRAVITTLICNNGRVGSAQSLSERLGLRSRYQLGRLLQREGLPPYEELAGWVCVFHWMLSADAGVGRGRLRPLAGSTHMDTATCYRLVRRVTGRCWTDLRTAGTAEVLRWFRQRVHAPHLKRPLTPVRPITFEGHPLQLAACPGIGWSSADQRRLSLKGAPYGVAVRGRDLAYITRCESAAIECLDLNTGRSIQTIPVGCTPTCVTFDSAGARAYVSVQFLGEIAVIDTHRHLQVQTLRVPGDPFPLALPPGGRILFVATNEDRLLGVSLQSGRIVGSVALPATSHHLALHPSGDRLYVATRAGGSVLEIDANRFVVLRKFDLGGWPQGLAVSSDGTWLYVANEQHGLDVLRLCSGQRVQTLEAESGAVALALSPDNRFLYAGFPHTGRVSVIDLPLLTRRGTLETGGRPGQIAFQRGGSAIITNERGWVDIVPIGGLQLAAGSYGQNLTYAG